MVCAKCWKRWLCLMACPGVNDQFDSPDFPCQGPQDDDANSELRAGHPFFCLESEFPVK